MPKPAAARTASVPRPTVSSKYLRFGILVLAISAIALIIGGDSSKSNNSQSAGVASACGPYRNNGQVRINGATFSVEIPRNSGEFAKGLGGRPCILSNQGMLFAFTKPGRYAFWMKDMKFPIDIIWIDTAHKVVAEEINESPSTYPDKFVNQSPAQYVLEIKANLSKTLHIGLGTPVSF